MSSEVFQYLCDLVDEGNGSGSVQKIAQSIILDGMYASKTLNEVCNFLLKASCSY